MDRQHPAGGSKQLADLIDKYGEILLPELKERYGIDLRDIALDVPPFSPRYVLAHIKQLPVESAFIAEIRGGRQFRGWGEDRYMRAAQLNAERASNYLFILANSDPKKKKPEAPDPWPLPDGDTKTKAPDKPGSFAFIARSLADKAKKRMEDGG